MIERTPHNEPSALKKFNARNEVVFGVIYEQLFEEFYYFARKLMWNSDVAPEDVVHDLFLYIWEHKDLKFETDEHLKGYIYLGIRNYYKNYLIKQQRKDKYKSSVMLDDDYFVSKMVETEIINEITIAINLLPEECAKVFKLFVSGLEMKEIAHELGKSESTIYNQRKMGIEILRKKLSKKSFLFFLSILSPI